MVISIMDVNYIQLYSNLLFSNEPDSDSALSYLKSNRGLTEDIIKLFQIGYCGKNSEVPGNDQDEKYTNSRLRGKIVIPIKSEFDDLLAFAARSSIAEEKGWWNQKFEKNNNLYLLNWSKEDILENSKVYIVEGYFDAITLYQWGIKNICSLMGTAFGHRRVGLLARYCEKVCLCFDTDEKKQEGKAGAGQLARAKSIYELNQYGWKDISYISMPVGVDPDEYIIKNGKDSFLGLEKHLTQKDIIRISNKYKQYTK